MTATATRPAARTRRTQSERRAEAEQRLLAAAAELISESGPAAVTLANVGERAGYSRGLAAHHFGSKASLMQAVADAVSRSFGAALARASTGGGSVRDELMVLVDVYFSVIADPPPMNRARLVLIADAVAHADAEGRATVLAADHQFRTALATRFAEAVSRGAVPADVDPEALAVTMVGLLRGIAFESMLDPTVDLDAARAEVEAFLTARFPT